MKWIISVLNRRTGLLLLLVSGLSCAVHLKAERVECSDDTAAIYDDFDDGRFGRSEYRSVLRCVKLSAFRRSETLPVYSPDGDENSYLTAVVLSSRRYEELSSLMDSSGLILYRRDGLEFLFSLEKPGESLLSIIDDYYRGSRASWRDPVRTRYLENYVIRIHSAENIFEPWIDSISYSEALLMATLIGDEDQWLWGIHDGLALEFP